MSPSVRVWELGDTRKTLSMTTRNGCLWSVKRRVREEMIMRSLIGGENLDNPVTHALPDAGNKLLDYELSRGDWRGRYYLEHSHANWSTALLCAVAPVSTLRTTQVYVAASVACVEEITRLPFTCTEYLGFAMVIPLFCQLMEIGNEAR